MAGDPLAEAFGFFGLRALIFAAMVVPPSGTIPGGLAAMSTPLAAGIGDSASGSLEEMVVSGCDIVDCVACITQAANC